VNFVSGSKLSPGSVGNIPNLRYNIMASLGTLVACDMSEMEGCLHWHI